MISPLGRYLDDNGLTPRQRQRPADSQPDDTRADDECLDPFHGVVCVKFYRGAPRAGRVRSCGPASET